MDDDKKTVDILVHREKKWLKMISKWDSKTTKEKLNKRIYKGIPDKLRSTVWAKLLNLETVMKDQSNLKKYDEMLQLAKQYSTEARQIDSDVNRQFREHIFYRERYNQRQKSLFNVLVAYSMYNMEVNFHKFPLLCAFINYFHIFFLLLESLTGRLLSGNVDIGCHAINVSR